MSMSSSAGRWLRGLIAGSRFASLIGRVGQSICLAVAWGAACSLCSAQAADKQTPQQNAEQDRVKAQAFRDALGKEMNSGNADAMIDLATITEQGDAAAPADRMAAMNLFEKAADKHNPFAREKVCIAYLLGEGRTQDIAKASTYCDPLGVQDPVGLFWAGYTYEHGIGGPADETSALEIYSRAVDLGSGDAADALGQIALQRKAPSAARKWFCRGVMLGSADAMDHLARMTEIGEAGEADTSEAGWLYSHAATLGNVDAQAWMKDHSGAAAIALVALTSTNGKKTEFTHTYTAKGKPAEEALDLAKIVRMLGDNYPGADPYSMPVEGNATIECYVNSRHDIDTCVVREFPIAYNFGQTLEAFFSGRVSVSEQDADGAPTARKRVALTVRWELPQIH